MRYLIFHSSKKTSNAFLLRKSKLSGLESWVGHIKSRQIERNSWHQTAAFSTLARRVALWIREAPMWPFYFCHARLSKIIIIRKLAVILLWFPKRSILKIPVIITRGDNHHKRNRLPTSCHDWPMTTERHLSSNWLCLYRHLCNLCAWAIQSQNNDISQDMSQALLRHYSLSCQYIESGNGPLSKPQHCLIR